MSLVTSAMLAAEDRRQDPVLGVWPAVVEAGNAVGGFGLVTFMTRLIYKAMPRQRVLAADVWLRGADFTGVYARTIGFRSSVQSIRRPR